MTIIKKIHVGGALYPIVTAAVYDPNLRRYTVEVRHANGDVQKAYARLELGPYVFHAPSTQGAHP